MDKFLPLSELNGTRKDETSSRLGENLDIVTPEKSYPSKPCHKASPLTVRDVPDSFIRSSVVSLPCSISDDNTEWPSSPQRMNYFKFDYVIFDCVPCNSSHREHLRHSSLDYKNKYTDANNNVVCDDFLNKMIWKDLESKLVKTLYCSGMDSRMESYVGNSSGEIYCSGLLLEAAQNAHIYNDSKSFVDMKMKYEPEIILERFEKLENDTDGKPSDEQVKVFVIDNFLPPGSEFETWIPEDWVESPEFLDNIVDAQLRSWASDLNELWKELGRKIHLDVKMNSSRYSMIYSPNPIIVPGGRFREFYYWDTYWIIRGLLLSEMYSTVEGIIKNFVDMVESFDFVPNGGRLYYTRRSQPPFLTLMARAYYDKTGAFEFIKTILPSLEKEYNFWMKERSVTVKDSTGKNHTLNQYASKVNQPRPESYREDLQLIKGLPEDESLELMSHITSACESGWDFSTRWTGSCINVSSTNLLRNLRTKDIIPVDLNSILAAVERDLAYFHKIAGDVTKANEFKNAYERRTEAIEEILWHESDGTYYDYLISQKASNRQYFASNVNPLWTKCYSSSVDIADREKRIYKYLQSTGALDYPGGIPASLNSSGQQWDFPNAWPPLVHMIIVGLETSEVSELKQEAYIQAQKWILSNWKAYNKTNAMFEKYDVTRDDGVPGSGGEYDVQKGFGWTNGVVLSLLDTYGQKLIAGPCDGGSCLPPTNAYEHTTSSACKRTSSTVGTLVVATAFGLGSGTYNQWCDSIDSQPVPENLESSQN